MTNRVSLTEFRWNNQAANERQLDLSAVRMTGNGQSDSGGNRWEKIGIVRKCDGWCVVRHLLQRYCNVRMGFQFVSQTASLPCSIFNA